MKYRLLLLVSLAVCAILPDHPAVAGALQRQTILSVGSSTVYPFAAYLSETIGATTNFETPLLASIGSGAGQKLFYTNNGLSSPDIVNSSRRMKREEFETGQRNGIGEVIEVGFGYDGIVLAHHKSHGGIRMTLEDIHLAIAAEVPASDGRRLIPNPYKRWKEINPKLPDWPIVIYGPPDSSGTFDVLKSLIMEKVSSSMPAYKGKYTRIREDGAYKYSGEDDSKIVREIINNPQVMGIFGFSFLEKSRDYLAGVEIEGYLPSTETIEKGVYPLARKLYMYVKKERIVVIPGLDRYIDMLLSQEMSGKNGKLERMGLITFSEADLAAAREHWEQRITLTLDDL